MGVGQREPFKKVLGLINSVSILECFKVSAFGAVVMAQSLERYLPTPEIYFESQHLQNFIYQLYILLETTKIKKKGPGMAHL